MAGLSTIGEAASVFLVGGRAVEMTGLAQAVGRIGMVGVLKPEARPITLSAVEQLTAMTYLLLRVQSDDIRFTSGQIRQSIQLLARLLLESPDTPVSSIHSNYLAPYFSSTSFTSLRSRLTPLVNALLQADQNDKNAETLAHNIAEWADDLHRDLKDLLLAAVQKQSHFTFDLIHWITGISELLIAVGRAPATSAHTKQKLDDDAEALFAVLGWVPRNPDTARWLEAYSFTETIFEFGLTSHSRGFEGGFNRAWNLLLRWALEAGRENTGWGTLARTLQALVALALATAENRADLLKIELAGALAKPDAPPHDVRDSAAHSLRAWANDVRARQFETRPIERILAHNDRNATRTLMGELADILSPPPAEPPVSA
jgi:hypothetical protein